MSVFTNQAATAGEEAKAYITAVLELLGERDVVEVLRGTPAELRRVTEGRAPEELRRPERSGKWSAVQVMKHLADSDLVWAYRMRLVLAEDRPRLVAFDQDLWAADCQRVDLAEALNEFEMLRALNIALIDRLDTADLERVGIHSARGEESLDLMIRMYAGHDLVHLKQLERIL